MLEKARKLVREFKGDSYLFGLALLPSAAERVVQLGQRLAVVRGHSEASGELAELLGESLSGAGVTVLGEISGARPNAPREDVTRLAAELDNLAPQAVVVIGGGSGIDATKAAGVLHALGGPIDDYFGGGKVTAQLQARGQTLAPLVAMQTAASSAAHLTKYTNVTDLATGQKKLIVDEAIVPPLAVFDYGVTTHMPADLTADGAFDGLSHALEVLVGSVSKPGYEKIAEVATEAIGLVVHHVERAVDSPGDLRARTALGLATDLGGYAIMLGGTNGGHLTSFSLVDILTHGRACAIMNPYYMVFFAPAIEEPLRLVGRILRRAGLTDADMESLGGRDLGIAIAQGMHALSRRVGFPTTLAEVAGFEEEHIQRALTAAKDPQLRMKLENMPVPLTADMIDEYMRPVLEAARDGDLDRIRNVAS